MKASVLVPTYNHARYISQCLDSLISQKTNFEFEIIVGEDDSTDNTRNICKEYEKNHPDSIRLFLNDRSNVIYLNGKPSGRWNLMNLLLHARGEYIAICEGDDYWTDSEKLNKQITFLDDNPNLSFCFHPVNWLIESSKKINIYQPKIIKETYSIDDLLVSKNFIALCSVLYRSSILRNIEDWFKFIPYGDLGLHLFSASKGPFGFIPTVMATYRRHREGFYSSESPVRRTMMAIQTLHLIHKAINLERFPGYQIGLSNFYLQLSNEAVHEANSIKDAGNSKNDILKLRTDVKTDYHKDKKEGFSDSKTSESHLEDRNNDEAIIIFLRALDELNRLNFYEADKLMDFYRRQIDYSIFSNFDNRANNSPFISVVVVAFNTNLLLLECIYSLLQQSQKYYEIIVIDNGRNEKVIEKLSKLPILYIKCPTNLFLSEGRNIGVFYARGKIVSFLDDDACVPANYIETIRQCFTQFNIVAFRGKVLPKTASPNCSANHYDLGDIPGPSTIDTEGNSSFNRDAYIKVGGMNPLLFGMEGLDISYKLMNIFGDNCTIYWPSTIIYHDFASTENKLEKKLTRYSLMRKYLTSKYPDIYEYHQRLRSCLSDKDSIIAANKSICLQDSPSTTMNNFLEAFKDTTTLYQESDIEPQSPQRPISFSSTPYVSIVIPTYNREHFLPLAIESALSQDIGYNNFEVLVVDDGSTDNTTLKIKQFKDKRFRYIKKEHSGAPKTRNFSIAEARGDYILWLDDDDLLTPSALSSYINFISTAPEADIIYGNLIYFDSDTDEITKIFEPFDWTNKQNDLLSSLFRTNSIPNPATLIKKSAYYKVGMYDESFERAHDYEFWTRAAAVLNFKKNDTTVCRYRIHSNNMSVGSFIDRSFESQIMRKMLHRYGLQKIYNWLNWEEPETATAVALYMTSENFLRIGDTHNALQLISEIPTHLHSADICDLRLSALLYQGKTKEAWNLLNSFSSNATINDDELIALRTNFEDRVKFHKTLSISFSNRDHLAIQKMLKMLDDEGRLIPAHQIIAFCDQHRHAMSERKRLKFLQSAIIQNPTCEKIRNQAIGLVSTQEARETLDATRRRVLDSIVESQTENTKPFKAKRFRPREAIKFSKLTIQHDENTSNLYRDACRFYEKENYRIAFEKLNRAIAIEPGQWEFYNLLVNILLQSGEELAIPDRLRPLEVRFDLPARMLALIGCGYEAVNDLERAAAFTAQALAIDAECARAWNLKGIISYRNGNGEAAARFFQKAAECDADWGDPWTNMGTLHWEIGAIDKAMDCYEKGFQLSPTAPNIATTYHLAISETGQFERAKFQFEQAIKHRPDFRKARFLLIDILIRMEAYQEALNHIEAVLVRFGAEPQFLKAAKAVRDKLGPMAIRKGKHPSLSLCMIVKNEEKYIPRCLESLKPVVDEMIVVDTGSTDATIDIAAVFGARLFNFKWNDDFAAARNHSLEKATGDWILVMDADEVVASTDHKPLRTLIRKHKKDNIAFSIVTRNYTSKYNGIGWVANDGTDQTVEAGCGWTPSKKVRLFKNTPEVRFEFPVHELVDTNLKRHGFQILQCPFPIHHYGNLDSIHVNLKGEQYYNIGKKKLKEMGNDPIALQELAVQADLLEKHDEAVDLWNRLAGIQPKNSKIYINLSAAYEKLGRYTESKKAACKAIKLGPNVKEAHLNLGRSELFLGNFLKAYKIFQNLVHTEPNYYSALFMACAAEICSGQTKNKLVMIKKMKSLNIWDALPHAFQDLANDLALAGFGESAKELTRYAEELERFQDKNANDRAIVDSDLPSDDPIALTMAS
ncbi:MAG: glycosyltransferase [Desulfobacteraceae bacterium]|nr:glycosyltransferase [Desulfobacteraceae bacterium]MBC2752904.1 glycosyltransferase [Desulfobacteraceae bacterium]